LILLRAGACHEKLWSFSARGLTTVEIQGHFEDLYRTQISPTLISTITVQSRAVSLALSVNLQGHTQLLRLWIGEKEGSNAG
jgi:transposase-like protein